MSNSRTKLHHMEKNLSEVNVFESHSHALCYLTQRQAIVKDKPSLNQKQTDASPVQATSDVKHLNCRRGAAIVSGWDGVSRKFCVSVRS